LNERPVAVRPQPEEVPVSFAGEPGRDDGNLPPLNVVVPDDARELDRDVLAYRREMRAQRRRQRFVRFFRPLRSRQFGGHAAVIPLIAICLAVALVGGALLSVATMSPASAPTLSGPQSASPPVATVSQLTELPAGDVQLVGKTVAARSLVTSVIALVPASCDCGPALRRLVGQAVAAHVRVYFAAAGGQIAQARTLTAHYGDGSASAVADNDSVLTAAYRPVGLTVLLVFRDATAEVLRDLPANFQLPPVLRELGQPGAARSSSPAAAS
jgi:hypothetical protein